ncbi:TetR/AcrR family transcriptional regulator [Paracoccus sp. 11-3]|uniref:TetR/AcrR family transcriptional regulator n=1 Tax=Paracoccus amoyensis TaxID=2760093 RepID=A0A926GHG5_9RHOB|nr:TetR/AcrR family transcriptional regulator [Paracoccus amoyensis]MBC9247399.1 TetR/AcrR family transcriptional regulator [Paracoccus amoyensis]
MTQIELTSKAKATRQHILDTGYTLVLHKGFAGIGLQEILRAADVPKGSFYHYFASKEAFGVALLQDYVERCMVKLNDLLEQPGTGRDLLMRYLHAWSGDPDRDSEPGWKQDCLVVKLAAEVADMSEDMRLVLTRATDSLVARIAGLIAEGRSDGSIPQGADAQALAQCLYQMWLGAALLSKLTRTDEPMRRAVLATEHLLACTTGSNPERMTP